MLFWHHARVHTDRPAALWCHEAAFWRAPLPKNLSCYPERGCHPARTARILSYRLHVLGCLSHAHTTWPFVNPSRPLSPSNGISLASHRCATSSRQKSTLCAPSTGVSGELLWRPGTRRPRFPSGFDGIISIGECLTLQHVDRVGSLLSWRPRFPSGVDGIVSVGECLTLQRSVGGCVDRVGSVLSSRPTSRPPTPRLHHSKRESKNGPSHWTMTLVGGEVVLRLGRTMTRDPPRHCPAYAAT